MSEPALMGISDFANCRKPTPPTTSSLPSDRACRTPRRTTRKLGQHFARLLHLTLVAPEPCEAHGGAEFQGFGLLLACDRDRSLASIIRGCPSRTPTSL